MATEVIRAIDHDLTPDACPDMTEHGLTTEERQAPHEKVRAAVSLLLCGPSDWATSPRCR